MNLRDLRHGRMNSKMARAVLARCYRDGRVYRVPMGPLRGVRLRYQASINYHAMLGLWELESVRFLKRVLVDGGLISRDAVVLDVGANIGMYALWLSRTCVPKGVVYAFEAAPGTFHTLQDTLQLNGAGNVIPTEAAVADVGGPIEFFIGFHHHASSLHQDWAAGETAGAERVVVAGITLDEFLKRHAVTPAFIKMDIEGGGVEALKGASGCLTEHRPLLLIESHNPNEDRAISHVLTAHDYQAWRLDSQSWVADRHDVHPNRQGVWGTMFLVPTERHAAVKQLLG